MIFSQKLLAVLLVVLTFALPAYANNPPQPDGFFSVLLIFPVVVFGFRLAGCVQTPKKLYVRIISGFSVAICSFVFLATGTIIGAFSALIVVIFAIVRACQIMHHGKNVKSLLIGTFILAFSVFAFVDYWASIVTDYKSASFYEGGAEIRLKVLSDAEQEFVASSHRSSSGGPVYGSLKDLAAARKINDDIVKDQPVGGYLFGEILDADKTHYIFYAIPDPQLKPAANFVGFVPGASLFKSLFGKKNVHETGRYSFAVDETGKMRQTIRTTNAPVTREEFSQWPLAPGAAR